jgi:hypothetical protein
MELELESRALKASLVLEPAALAGVEVPNGLSKVTLRVAVLAKTIIAEVNAKSLRRTVAAIAAAGPNGVAVVLQGKLEPGDVLTEAGIVAQPKTPKTPANSADSAKANADELTGQDPHQLVDLNQDGTSRPATGKRPLGTGHVLSHR